MGKIIERCAGIDIGKRFLLCCVMTGAANEEPRSETRRFDTTVPGLERLRNWLNDEQVTDVVMESTGSYWIPVFNLLEGRVTIVLANPEEVKNRRGHKTDRKDAEHLADLLRHNHVRSSYIPAEPVRQLRDLTRRRVQLTLKSEVEGTEATGTSQCEDWQRADGRVRCLWAPNAVGTAGRAGCTGGNGSIGARIGKT
jgi:hypothetical protein